MPSCGEHIELKSPLDVSTRLFYFVRTVNFKIARVEALFIVPSSVHRWLKKKMRVDLKTRRQKCPLFYLICFQRNTKQQFLLKFPVNFFHLLYKNYKIGKLSRKGSVWKNRVRKNAFDVARILGTPISDVSHRQWL